MSVGAPSPEAGALVASVGVAAFGAVWLVAQVSAAISACLLLVGARTIAGSAFGLRAAPGHEVSV